MSIRGHKNPSVIILNAGVVVLSALLGCTTHTEDKQVPVDQQARLEAMRARGTQASLTVFPVVMGDATHTDVADVLALMLEQAGMTHLETTDTVFRLPEEGAFDQAAERFGEFVRAQPIDTDYALYTEFVGAPPGGPQEVRGIVVDQAGRTVLVERQTPADKAFRRAQPDCPMTCCQFMAERVRSNLHIPKSARDDSGTGKFARQFARNSPAPGAEEWAAMTRRQSAMKQVGRSATVAVFPVRLSDDTVGRPEADYLVTLLNENRLCTATAVDSSLRVKIEPARNEQKLLWDLARVFQDHVKQNPPAADYALMVDYMMHPEAGRAWAVHTVLCDRAGEWVIVDFQNDHHDDFQSIEPKTLNDCSRLVVKRLAGHLR